MILRSDSNDTPLYVRINSIISSPNLHRFGGHSVEIRWRFGGHTTKEERSENGLTTEKKRKMNVARTQKQLKKIVNATKHGVMM
ncbi:MAG: hypothetical protein IKQ72_02740 [Bacteroidaceae bacterium]|nr:hypothetical protein [Bacteroidaceae bacterium]